MGVAASIYAPTPSENIQIVPHNNLMIELASGKHARKALDNLSLVICTTSWDFIRNCIGLQSFTARFFLDFETSHPSACSLFHPHTASRKAGNTRESLLVYILQYILSITSFDKDTKKKLRALGRRHVLSGITQEHFHAFSQVYIQTLMSFGMNVFNERDIVKAWLGVLASITEEMFSEKIVLVSCRSTSISVADSERIEDKPLTPASNSKDSEQFDLKSSSTSTNSIACLTVQDLA